MRAIEHLVEEESVVKKARLVDDEVQEEEVSMPVVVDVVKETCVGDGSENSQVCNIVVEEEKNKKKIEAVDTEHMDPKETLESEDVYVVVSGDVVDVVKETCVGDGSENSQVCNMVVEEEKNEKIEGVDTEHMDLKETLESEDVDVVVSGDVVDVVKETCVAASGGDGSENSQVCNIVVKEEKNKKIEEVSDALSLVDTEHMDPKETLESEDVDVVVSGDANTEKLPALEREKNNEASVTPVVPVMDSLVDAGGIKEVVVSNPSVLRRKLLVLDLNGLLADIVSPLADCKADIIIGRRAIFKRPFCEEFLKFCFDKFEVGIWSSRKKNNVDRITEFLLGDMKSKLLFCWDMSYCATTTLGSLENRHKYVVFKDLCQLWEKHDPKLPWQKGDYNETNTVLLDDSPYKALLNPPYTAIFPHSYSHQNKSDTSLGNGGDLRLHLEKLVEAENVQDFIKNNPFGQEAITEASETWEFYREATRTHTHVRI